MDRWLAVALRKESVDRKCICVIQLIECGVALRKESVDRKVILFSGMVCAVVALRKESVDRKMHDRDALGYCYSRSPQGERG